MASLLRSQADGLSSRDAKQAFQKMADYYQHEAEQLPGSTPKIVTQSKHAKPGKSAA